MSAISCPTPTAKQLVAPGPVEELRRRPRHVGRDVLLELAGAHRIRRDLARRVERSVGVTSSPRSRRLPGEPGAPACPGRAAASAGRGQAARPVAEHGQRRRRAGRGQEGQDEDVGVPEDVAVVGRAGEAAWPDGGLPVTGATAPSGGTARSAPPARGRVAVDADLGVRPAPRPGLALLAQQRVEAEPPWPRSRSSCGGARIGERPGSGRSAPRSAPRRARARAAPHPAIRAERRPRRSGPRRRRAAVAARPASPPGAREKVPSATGGVSAGPACSQGAPRRPAAPAPRDGSGTRIARSAAAPARRAGRGAARRCAGRACAHPRSSPTTRGGLREPVGAVLKGLSEASGDELRVPLVHELQSKSAIACPDRPDAIQSRQHGAPHILIGLSPDTAPVWPPPHPPLPGSQMAESP